jgi:colicin import membrane protein
MRDFGLPISAFAHVVLLAAAVFALPSVSPLEPPAEDSVPVEILTPEEFSAITKGEKTAKPADKPQQKVDKVEPVPTPQEEDPAELVKRESATPPPPEALPTPRPETKPPEPVVKAEPKPAEEPKPKDEPKPDPKADAAKLDELALRASQESEPKPKPEEKPKKTAEKKPEKKETPKKTEKAAAQPGETERAFDPSKVAALLSKDKAARKEKTGEAESQTAALGSAQGTAPKLSLSQRNALVTAIMNHVTPCWSPPSFAADARSLAVVIAVDLNEAGQLSAEPSVVKYPASSSGTAAAGAALRALKRCITAESPLKLPPELYGSWRALEINFDPRELAGG